MTPFSHTTRQSPIARTGSTDISFQAQAAPVWAEENGDTE